MLVYEWTQKKGKLFISHRYNQTPLLYSYPGGFNGSWSYKNGSWSYKTYPIAKVLLFFELARILLLFFCPNGEGVKKGLVYVFVV